MIRIVSPSNSNRLFAVVSKNQALRFKSSAASITSEGRFFPRIDSDTLLRKNSSTSKEQTQPAAFNKIAFLGSGNMAQAILNPIVRTGLQPADQVTIFDKSQDTIDAVASHHPDIQVAGSIPELVDDADLVVCCVKPQNIDSKLLTEIRESRRPSHATFLSIIAGVPMEAYIPTGYEKIVRSMPNTPAMIGRGMTVWCGTDNLTATERKRIDTVLGCLGETMFVDSEQQIDISTALSGSAPAYVFCLLEDMIDAGVHMGFPRDKATKLVYHTVLGSTLYAMETGEHPAILRNNVTSPNGTTASAIYELENGGFRTAVKDAMWACYRRSLEMGHHDSNVGPGRSQISEEALLRSLLDTTDGDTDFKITIGKKEHDDKSNNDNDRWAA